MQPLSRTALLALAMAGVTTTAIPQEPKPTLFVVTYSHLDTEWCWTYRHSINDFIPNTLRENFELFEKYPNYRFNWTGAMRYRFMKQYYPAEFARLKQYVAQGRWIPSGANWDENDAIVPSPESLIRSILYANLFYNEEFGKTGETYLVPDTFGFPASLPTVLNHAGMKGFSSKKLTYGAGSAVGIPFNVGRWIGPDGSAIVSVLNPGDYRTRVTADLSQDPKWLERILANGKASGVYVDGMYHGNGDEGGSPGAASADWLEKSLRGTGPIEVRAGHADELFLSISPQQALGLPEYKGDLLLIQHSAGSINSGAAMKEYNHRNELLADASERASVAARLLTGLRYPGSELREGWQRFLGGQMHDILPGTSLPEAYRYAWNDQAVALNTFADIERRAVDAVARRMDTRGRGTPVLVFNPMGRDRTEVVEATLPISQGKSIRAVGPDGKSVPVQRIVRSGNRVTVAFRAHVPSVGFAVYDLQETASSPTDSLSVTDRSLQSDRYRVELNEGGDISRIYDRLARREVLRAPMRLAFLYEKPAQHPAWNMDWNDRQKPPVGYVEGPAKVEIVENGPVRVALKVTRESEGSRFEQIVRLTAGGDRVEFESNIDWRTRERSLKAVFPLTVENPQATYNWQVGTVERTNNDPKKYEVPTHRWMDLTAPDGSYGTTILTQAKYGTDKPDDHTLRLTLLYTPGVRERFQHQGTQDFGHHTIRYGLVGHAGNWQKVSQDAGEAFNQPLVPFAVTKHRGNLGKSLALLRVSHPGVTLAALKQAEGSSEVIARFFESSGRPATGVRVTSATKIQFAREVNGQEAPVSTEKMSVAKGELSFDMAPYRPRAFAIRFGNLPGDKTRSQTVALPWNADVTSPAGVGRGKADSEGRSYPAELIPNAIESGEVTFNLRPRQTKNAVRAQGQKLTVPASGGTLYLLAAAESDLTASFTVGGRVVTRKIQSWAGEIGQADTRLWKGEVSDRTATWTNELLGIRPAFAKPDPIAFFSDHWRLADGTNDAYRPCYMFRYAIPVPKGVRTVTLPRNPKVMVFAATYSATKPVAELAVRPSP